MSKRLRKLQKRVKQKKRRTAATATTAITTAATTAFPAVIKGEQKRRELSQKIAANERSHKERAPEPRKWNLLPQALPRLLKHLIRSQ